MRVIRTIATIAVIAAATTGASQAKNEPKIQRQISTAIVATWNCQDKIAQQRSKAQSPWKPHSQAFYAWQLGHWTKKLKACRAALAERDRQHNWQAWLPGNWVAVARCETGINWSHANSSYVSAFGIQRGNRGGQYDDDARKVGMPPWNDARPPTPWQQYQTALSHYRSFGDGWGCPGP